MEESELARLYRDHGWHVFRRSLRILGDEEEARDVCQEVFVRLVRAWEDVRGCGHVRAWVFRTTTNLAIDRLRVRKPRDDGALDGLAGRADTEGEVGRSLLVRRLLEPLRENERSLAVLRYVDGCTLEELESICGATRKTLRKRLERIREKARAVLGDDEAPPGGWP